MSYTKLFDSIVASSVWDLDDKTRLVWVTMLALRDRYQFVRGTENFLALAARVNPVDCRRALEILSGPDLNSRTPDNEGRRVRSVPGGWEILNGALYQNRLSIEERREYNRQKQAEYRRRRKRIVHEGACAGAVEAIADGFKEVAEGSKGNAG